jgi:hypothetical protein
MLSRQYNTEAKILETFALAEANGIQTFMTHARQPVLDLVKRHRVENKGRLQCLVSPVSEPREESAYAEEAKRLVDEGVNALYIFGGHADRAVHDRQLDQIRGALEMMKKLGVPAGVSAHALETIEACEKGGVEADFYLKTFHHHRYGSAPKPGEATQTLSENIPAYWCRDPEQTIAVMEQVRKPWIAFKVMAAGAIPPLDGFRYAIASGADFILAGMFDFQIEANAQLMRKMLSRNISRKRPWRA